MYCLKCGRKKHEEDGRCFKCGGQDFGTLEATIERLSMAVDVLAAAEAARGTKIDLDPLGTVANWPKE